MASTSSTAEVASKIIPFHCIICFDEFNFTDRTPMVLPCGHTYVCASCTKRLKRCMECRQPLFWNPTITAASPPLNPTQPRAAPARYGRPQPNALRSPPRKPNRNSLLTQVALPMPRNVVMIAMMEAAQSQTVIEDRAAAAATADESTADQEIEVLAESGVEEGEDLELNNTMEGIEALSGTSGTYAVKEPEGLAVLPFDPRKKNGDAPLSINAQEPYNIEKGRTLQVVEAGEGVYKLARGNGYIVASDSQLVKVGGPRDSSCRLEGIHDLVNVRKQALLAQLEKLESLSTHLTDQIVEMSTQEPSYPIITDRPEEDDLFQENCQPSLGSAQFDRGATMSPQRMAQMELGSGVASPTGVLAPRTPNTIDNSDIGEYADENIFPGESPYLCSPFSFLSGSQDSEDRPRALMAAPRSFEVPSHIRPRLSPRGGHGHGSITPSSSVGAVDFSTGMSGHRAMSSKSSRNQGVTQRHVRMMGDHRGASSFRATKRQSNESSSLAASSTASTGWTLF